VILCRLILRVCLVVALVLLAVPTLARAIGATSAPLSWLVALTPWVALACVVLLVLTLLARSTLLAILAVALCAVQAWWLAPLFIADHHIPESQVTVDRAAGRVLTVMTLNLKYGSADPAAVVRLVKERDVDLLALEELTSSAVSALHDAGLDALLPHSFTRPTDAFTGTGLWSRAPLTDERTMSGFTSEQLVARVTVAGQTMTVAAIHPISPSPFDNTTWLHEYATLLTDLDAITGTAVIAGDFNATRDQGPFRSVIATGYVDGADQAGAGLHFTFPQQGRLPPLVTIDHVLSRNSELSAAAVQVIPVPGTDHAALIVTYAPTP
jgi:endonuclease/exonuclease/phosphatase (EEP) superfamily protein YafD